MHKGMFVYIFENICIHDMYVYMYILYVYMEVYLKYTYVKSFLLNTQKLQSSTDTLFCKKI